MKLYYCETPNPRKACALARYLNLPVEWARIDLAKRENMQPEFLAINPNGKVPVLEDGDMKLWEANAIMCYLAERAGSELWPDDGRRIDIIRWFCWEGSHFSRQAGTMFFENVIKPRFGIGAPDQAAISEAAGFFKRFATILDDHLRGRRYLVGDSLTLADFAVAMMLPYAEESRLPMEGFSEIQRWHGRLNEIEAWRMPFPAPTAAAA